jgi:predicted aldo/keto reductase-like oxidoreductase
MEYVKLGQTGLKVSRLCLGCMTYGTPEKGWNKWVLHEDQRVVQSSESVQPMLRINESVDDINLSHSLFDPTFPQA